jgi:hypothetical protein
MRVCRTFAIGVPAAGLVLLTVLVAGSPAAQPLRARLPSHAEILNLHARMTYGPVSQHVVRGRVHTIRHVDSYVVPGARVGRALPPGHYPIARVTVPAGSSMTLGAGDHFLSLLHDGGQWRVFAAGPDGRVHEAGNVQVGAVRSGRLPPDSLTAGGLNFSINFPVGLDPFGNPMYVTIGFLFP